MDDLAEYIANNYGVCDRGDDCFHGKDEKGHHNGCLYFTNPWLGRGCPHWKPVKAKNWEELAKEQEYTIPGWGKTKSA